ncbi:MAG: hypothetical protein AAF805_13270, partial [Planctomycetota bacterium]
MSPGCRRPLLAFVFGCLTVAPAVVPAEEAVAPSMSAEAEASVAAWASERLAPTGPGTGTAVKLAASPAAEPPSPSSGRYTAAPAELPPALLATPDASPATASDPFAAPSARGSLSVNTVRPQASNALPSGNPLRGAPSRTGASMASPRSSAARDAFAEPAPVSAGSPIRPSAFDRPQAAAAPIAVPTDDKPLRLQVGAAPAADVGRLPAAQRPPEPQRVAALAPRTTAPGNTVPGTTVPDMRGPRAMPPQDLPSRPLAPRELPAAMPVGPPPPREMTAGPAATDAWSDPSPRSAPLAPFAGPPEGVGRPGPAQMEGPQRASLVVEKRGPSEARIGQPCRFLIKVRNTGDAPADDVVLIDQAPAGARLLATVPTAEMRSGEAVWRLGAIAAGEERTVEMRIEPTREGPLGSVARVTMAAAASASTVATRPQLAIRASAADRVLVGDQQTLAIEVHNPGTGTATGVMLLGDVPPELSHPAGPELEYEVGSLAPGETRRIELRMTAQRAGAIDNRLRVVGDGDLAAETMASFAIVAPSLSVSLDGPKRRYLERPASYTVSIGNPGTAPAKDVRLVTRLPRGLEFVRANNLGEYDEQSHSVYWSLAELPEGQRGEVELVALPIAQGDHTLTVEGEARGGLAAEETRGLRVEGVASLAFEVRDLEDPIEVGEDTTYEVAILNEGTKSATNVRVRVEAPAGMRVVAAQGQSAHRTSDTQAEFAPLPTLAPGAKARYRVRLAGVRPGDQRVTVLVESDDLSRPIRR